MTPHADGQAYDKPLTKGGELEGPFYKNIYKATKGIRTPTHTHFVGHAICPDRDAAEYMAMATYERQLLYRIKVTPKP